MGRVSAAVLALVIGPSLVVLYHSDALISIASPASIARWLKLALQALATGFISRAVTDPSPWTVLLYGGIGLIAAGVIGYGFAQTGDGFARLSDGFRGALVVAGLAAVLVAAYAPQEEEATTSQEQIPLSTADTDGDGWYDTVERQYGYDPYNFWSHP